MKETKDRKFTTVVICLIMTCIVTIGSIGWGAYSYHLLNQHIDYESSEMFDKYVVRIGPYTLDKFLSESNFTGYIYVDGTRQRTFDAYKWKVAKFASAMSVSKKLVYFYDVDLEYMDETVNGTDQGGTQDHDDMMTKYNITTFPVLLEYENGELVTQYIRDGLDQYLDRGINGEISFTSDQYQEYSADKEKIHISGSSAATTDVPAAE